MDLDWDLPRKPEEPKPAWDGAYDEVEEMEKLRVYQAELEHEYRAISEIEKQDLLYWRILLRWNHESSLGDGIMLFLCGREERL
ncbi:hypothetical protein LCGC14_0318210 [marine sediment metagenome]|uniref:Uncharacterized protein n=1 Tax=marine sediment metagenome TaxID=412755 RepID=A0A0F9U2L8_9ZZZZ